MKKLAIIATMVFFAGSALAQTFNIDPAKSKVEWVGEKLGGQHNGTIAVKSGTMVLENGKLKSGTVEIDMNKIVVEDITNATWNKKLVDHLYSNDFFDSKTHATGKFEITKVTYKGDKALISGKLTLRGKTIAHPTPVEASVKVEGDEATGMASMEIDRTAFGLKYNSGKFFDPKKLGDKLIKDKFKVKLNLVAKKAS